MIPPRLQITAAIVRAFAVVCEQVQLFVIAQLTKGQESRQQGDEIVTMGELATVERHW